MGLFKHDPDEMNGIHVEQGEYYRTKNRYHLSLSGLYELYVDGDVYVIKPGMFFWFENSLPHAARNLGEDVRVSLVFDAHKSITYTPPK